MYQAGHNALRRGMNTRELPGGVTVHTFSPPPDGFDPVKAEEKELLAYGYPSRPQDPALAERWERVLSRPVRLIQPAFRSMPYKRRVLPKVTAGTIHDGQFSSNWSGAVVYAPGGDTFKWIEGEWTVPNAFPPPDAVDGAWYSASTWIGIDGAGSGDVLQAGCDSDVLTSGGVIQRQLSPWWEWFPAQSYWITNLPVAQGDTMDCLICVDPESTTAASIFMLNVTSGVGASFRATAPDGVSLTGNSAEWVVEKLSFDQDAPVELARYGDMYFSAANAGTVAGTAMNAGAGNILTMTDTGDESGNPSSTGLIETPTLVQVHYTGP